MGQQEPDGRAGARWAHKSIGSGGACTGMPHGSKAIWFVQFCPHKPEACCGGGVTVLTPSVSGTCPGHVSGTRRMLPVWSPLAFG